MVTWHSFRYGLIGLFLVVLTAPARTADKKEAIPGPRPPELKVLDRLVGTWTTDVVSKPAEWSPKEVPSKGESTFAWMLDGRFLRNSSKVTTPEKAESFQLMTYNPAQKEFYMWFFDSSGNVNEAPGKWDADAETLTWTSSPEENLTAVNRLRFLDKDTIQWTVLITDKNKKVYLDLRGKMTRKKKE